MLRSGSRVGREHDAADIRWRRQQLKQRSTGRLVSGVSMMIAI
ncbi:MAG: hypothetical protein ACYTGG_00570 [Planctomycetota bacterium]|jgi:hypothetical protein